MRSAVINNAKEYYNQATKKKKIEKEGKQSLVNP
jgi:hypothetical protein